jgi:hypothetical protein
MKSLWKCGVPEFGNFGRFYYDYPKTFDLNTEGKVE